MMKKILVLSTTIFLTAISISWAAGPYTASLTSDVYDATPDSTPTPNQGLDVPNVDIHNAVNALLGSFYTNNSDLDPFQHTGPDETWKQVTGPGENAPFLVIGVGAGNFNTLRLYDVTDPTNKIDVFGGSFHGVDIVGDGTAAFPFPAVNSPLASGTEFKFNFLSTDGITPGVEWDSDPLNNADGFDHMLTYHLTDLRGKTLYIEYLGLPPEQYTLQDPYLIAWEDLALTNGKLGDEDFNDTIYLVDRVVPVPEPMSMALLGSGLLGAFSLRRRRA